MRAYQVAVPCFAVFLSSTHADFLGSTFPAPHDFTSEDSLIRAQWESLSSKFDAYLNENASTAPPFLSGTENLTFSLGLFSIHDAAASSLQYHYTSPEIQNSAHGTNVVDGNSVYRVASVSKLITVFAGLIELRDEDWYRPLSDIIPGIAEYAKNNSGEDDPILTTQWDQITPWALASQIAGVADLGIVAADSIVLYAAGLVPNPVTALGFPFVNVSNFGGCWNFTEPCDAPLFIQSDVSQPPSFLPWTSPAYADNAFMILGIAISNLTGKSMDDVYREAVFEPLEMEDSFSHPPSSGDSLAKSVIAGQPAAGFAIDSPVTTPSGGLFSTINDLTKLGVGILNATLLSTLETRKWMKPHTHTASLSFSVGAPWEIQRYVHPSSGKVTDLYTKLGDSGAYGGMLMLIPDYDAGFCMLNAWSNDTLRGAYANAVLDYVTNALLPALEAQATAEAMQNYVGTYVSADPDVNSSLTVTFGDSNIEGASPALTVSSWISNSTDVLASYLFGGLKPRLLPTIPAQQSCPNEVAFQASTNVQYTRYEEAINNSTVIGPFTGQYNTNFDWLVVDNTHYAGRSVNLFVFELDSNGNATSATPAAARAKLVRSG